MADIGVLLPGSQQMITAGYRDPVSFNINGQTYTIGNAYAGFTYQTRSITRATFSISTPTFAGWNPHMMAVFEYYDPIAGSVVNQSFLIGGQYGSSYVTIDTGSLGVLGTGEVKIRLYSISEQPAGMLDPKIFGKRIGRWLDFVGNSLDAIDGIHESGGGRVQVLRTETIHKDLLNANFAPGYLESLGFDPDNLPSGLKGQFDHNGRLIGFEVVQPYCFAAGTVVVNADGDLRHIEELRVGDSVMAFDAGSNRLQGMTQPRRVTQTHVNMVDNLLDVAGLKVTPGHVFLCGDGPNKGSFEPLIDIIRRDGALVKEDGSLVRPSVDAPVGSDADRLVRVLYVSDPDGDPKPATLRAGTRLFLSDAEVTIAEILEDQGYELTDEGLVAKNGEVPEPLHWFGIPPKHEDYILAKSGLTLDELYHEVDGVTRLKAGEPVH